MIMPRNHTATFSSLPLEGELRAFVQHALSEADWLALSPPDGLQILKSVPKMRRAGHRMMFVRWQGEALVLKFYGDYGDPRIGRRMEFLLKNALTNYARRSYFGARYLIEAGIPSIEPVEYLNVGHWWARRGVFVYREVEAEQTLGQWLAANPEDSRRTPVFMAVGSIINSLRQARVIQPDLVKSNILAHDDGVELQMTLIDTDDVRQLPLWWPGFAFMGVFLWSLRRMRVPDGLRADFFRACMGGQASAGQYRFWRFIQDHNFKPWKRLLKKRK